MARARPRSRLSCSEDRPGDGRLIPKAHVKRARAGTLGEAKNCVASGCGETTELGRQGLDIQLGGMAPVPAKRGLKLRDRLAPGALDVNYSGCGLETPRAEAQGCKPLRAFVKRRKEGLMMVAVKQPRKMAAFERHARDTRIGQIRQVRVEVGGRRPEPMDTDGARGARRKRS